MLEIVPRGGDKWAGLQQLCADLRITPEQASITAGWPRALLTAAEAAAFAQVMACGDGGNDLTLVANAGLGIAMGNAVDKVKAAAQLVVASNDDGGIAQAIETFLL